MTYKKGISVDNWGNVCILQEFEERLNGGDDDFKLRDLFKKIITFLGFGVV